MRILAIDPGSKLGWCTDLTGRLEFGTEDFRIRAGESSGNRWRRFGEWLRSITIRIHPHKECGDCGFPLPLDKPCEFDPDIKEDELAPPCYWKPGESDTVEHLVDLIVYERAVFMPKARAAAEIAAGFTTRLEEHCERHGIALEPVAVQTLKAYALPRRPRKKGDPKMDRSKAAMIAAARGRLLPAERNAAFDRNDPIRATDVEAGAVLLTEHEADALFLYWMVKERRR